MDEVQAAARLLRELDRGRMPCRLVPTNPGDEIELSRENVVTVVATRHTIPSLGFIVWDRRRKLKAEYQGLAGEQIREVLEVDLDRGDVSIVTDPAYTKTSVTLERGKANAKTKAKPGTISKVQLQILRLRYGLNNKQPAATKLSRARLAMLRTL